MFSYLPIENIKIAKDALSDRAVTVHYQGVMDKTVSDAVTLNDDDEFVLGMLSEGKYNLAVLDSDSCVLRVVPVNVLGLMPKQLQDMNERLRLIETRLLLPGSFASSATTAEGQSVANIPFKDLQFERDKLVAQIADFNRTLSCRPPGRFV